MGRGNDNRGTEEQQQQKKTKRNERKLPSRPLLHSRISSVINIRRGTRDFSAVETLLHNVVIVVHTVVAVLPHCDETVLSGLLLFDRKDGRHALHKRHIGLVAQTGTHHAVPKRRTQNESFVAA